jgi:hypothetical protein
VNCTRQIDKAPPVVFRGTVLDRKRLARIRALVAGRRGWNRQELARELCRIFGWRRPNGQWAVRGARNVLVRLDEMGVIDLPAPRGLQGRPDREAVETAAAALAEGASAAAREEPARRRESGSVLVVRPIHSEEVLLWRAHMERFHYLGDSALVGESLRYVALLDGELVALLGWAAAALHNGPRDHYVGWDEKSRKANLHRVINNSRFLVLPWGRRPHLASRVLAANLRRVSRDWQERYGHDVVLAESFVDTARFRGTCYRASNWICVGETKGWTKNGNTYRFHGAVKSVWLYRLRRDCKAQLCTVGRGGTKQEGFMVVDVEKLPLEGQGGLFEVLCGIPDPRKRRGVRHKIQSVLATALCAVLGGARNITSMAEWAAEQSPQTLRRLGSKYGRPPSERTYRRVFASIDVAEVDRRTGCWVSEQERSLKGAGLALDGKTVRGSTDGENSARHLLSAIVHGSGTVVAQVDVDSKTNEITRVEPLLEGLDIQGAVVTGDALLTQKKIAKHLVKKKKAHYVFTAKDNQPTLRQDIATLGLDVFPPSARNRR